MLFLSAAKTHLCEFSLICCLPPNVSTAVLFCFFLPLIAPSLSSVSHAGFFSPPFLLSKKNKPTTMTIFFYDFVDCKEKKKKKSTPQLQPRSFTTSAPAESHTGDFLLTRTSDLPSALTRCLRIFFFFCGSSFAARGPLLCGRGTVTPNRAGEQK